MGADRLPDFMTAAQVGKWLGVPTKEIHALVRSGKLAAHQVGEGNSGKRFMAADVLSYLGTVRSGPDTSPAEAVSDDEVDEGIESIEDCYHFLHIGPCTPEMMETESGGALLNQIIVYSRDAFDCSYAEWVSLFRPRVQEAAARGGGLLDAEPRIPSEDDFTKASVTVLSKGSIILASGETIERVGDRWAILKSEYGMESRLVEIEDPMWSSFMDHPPLLFDSPFEAYKGLIRSEAICKARSDRYQDALFRLSKHRHEPLYGGLQQVPPVESKRPSWPR